MLTTDEILERARARGPVRMAIVDTGDHQTADVEHELDGTHETWVRAHPGAGWQLARSTGPEARVRA